MAEAIRLTGASRNTLKQHFRDLIGRKHLEQHGSGRGVWYGLKWRACSIPRLRIGRSNARGVQQRG